MYIRPVAEGLVNGHFRALMQREQVRSGAVGRSLGIDYTLRDDRLLTQTVAPVKRGGVKTRRDSKKKSNPGNMEGSLFEGKG